MFCPGDYVYYTRSNGVRVVATIVGSSDFGEEFRTIVYSRPSAVDPRVKVSVTNKCARIGALEAVRGHTPPTPGTDPSSIKCISLCASCCILRNSAFGDNSGMPLMVHGTMYPRMCGLLMIRMMIIV